ncbi:class I SAM-dependent methyltransferase [Planktothrix agardhii]|jgi:2-polyprenyl-3-methyl-5-hydroxy-6-metoxy-1,4-benzoquinol methylase|uniref:class I SAM-dependent methyltransferase n=1 Tax=Planktothrix agardhii TaxID=1160 RepID=UPI0028755FF7|nr:class I SAM-dependent methyltransferase [Planktothrix agardhii]MDS1346805.1 class I SAM-dependent methyltransferase [Planktothrix agardhii NRERC-751]
MSSDYQTKWNQYWDSIEDRSQVIWNVDAHSGIGIDLDWLKKMFKNPDLPLIDFGCGDGNITQLLAEKFPKVIGIDVSESALNLATIEAQKVGLAITYKLVCNQEDGQNIHKCFGDANIYMRSVMHQINIEDRPLFVDHLKTLIGKTGTLCLLDISSDPRNIFGDDVKLDDPLKVKKVSTYGITPGEVTLEEIENLFPKPDFSILESGQVLIPMNGTIKGKTVAKFYLYAIIYRLN